MNNFLLNAIIRNEEDKVDAILAEWTDIDIETCSKSLHAAVSVDASPKIIEALLKRGGDPDYEDKTGWSLLILNAVSSSRSLDAAKLLLAYGANVNHQDAYQRTALRFAASDGNDEKVRFLLDSKADPNIVDDNGESPLTVAVYKHHECAKILVESGADIDHKGYDGSTALMLAIKEKQFDTVKYLVEKGADLEITNDNGETAFLIAAIKGDMECLQYLHEKGANIFAKTMSGDPAITRAILGDNPEDAAKFLISKGIDLNEANYEGVTPLMRASSYARHGIVKMLIDVGAKLDEQDADGDTALMKACKNGASLSAEYLIAAKADLEKVNRRNDTAFSIALDNRYKLNGKDDVIFRALMRNGADINRQYEEGETKLIRALKSGRNLSLANLLITKKVDLNIRDNSGSTAMHWAAHHGSDVQINKMIKYGAALNCQDMNGYTALMNAIDKNNISTAKLLAGQKQNFDLVNVRGETALMMAIKHLGDKKTIYEIAEKTSNFEAKDKDGKTVLELSRITPEVHALIEAKLLNRSINAEPEMGQGMEF